MIPERAMQRQVTKYLEKRDEFIALLEEGKTIKEAACGCGVANNTIYLWRRMYTEFDNEVAQVLRKRGAGRKVVTGKASLLPKYRERVLQLARKGKSYKDIARELNLTRGIVSSWAMMHPDFGKELKEASMRAEDGRCSLPRYRGRILQMVGQGVSIRAITRELGISINSIKYWSKKFHDFAVELEQRKEIAKAKRKSLTSAHLVAKTRCKLYACRERVLELTREGKSQQEIAERVGICCSTILKWRKEFPDFDAEYMQAQDYARDQRELKTYTREMDIKVKRPKGEDDYDRRRRCRREGERYSKALAQGLKRGEVVAQRISPKLTVYVKVAQGHKEQNTQH